MYCFETYVNTVNTLEAILSNMMQSYLHIFQGKLDEYKSKVKGGATLNADQQKAVDCYESVVLNLEFAKELQKQFTEIQEKVSMINFR